MRRQPLALAVAIALSAPAWAQDTERTLGTVTVTGRGFTNVRTVTVNGTTVTPNVLSSTRLTFTAPDRPSGLGENYTGKPVVVVNGGGGPSTNDSSSAHLFSWTVF